MVRTRGSILSKTTAVLFNTDTLEGVASFLSCRDLANLSMVSMDLSDSVDDAALRLISSMHARYGGDDDLSPLEELHALRSPLQFDCLLGRRIGYVGGDKAMVYSSNPNTRHTPEYINMALFGSMGDWDGWDGDDSTALCSKYIMTSGKHFVKFDIATSGDGDYMMGFRYVYSRIGIMRPIPMWQDGDYGSFCPLRSAWFNDFISEKSEAWGSSDKNACLYYDFEGTCEWGDWSMLDTSGVHKVRWNGMEAFDGENGELGLLLDLDEGTLTVYKNGRRLGVMMDGLTGEYCWVVSMLAQSHGGPEEQNVRIRRAPIP